MKRKNGILIGVTLVALFGFVQTMHAGVKSFAATFENYNERVGLLSPDAFHAHRWLVTAVPVAITGNAIDTNGEPLIGVNVPVKGTNTGAATDFDGNFSLTDVEEDAVLVVSYIGYQTREIPVNRQISFQIVLESDSQLLDEVVVVGYGTQKKVNLTGAVSEIGSEELELRSVNNATQALQGLAPNLNVDVNASGGAADAGMNINIRGVGSLSSSSPYILINGVRASDAELSALNANDIASVSVLKDAASTAIYGAQAAFGVILIETKKGRKNQPFSINYSNSFRNKKRIYI